MWPNCDFTLNPRVLPPSLRTQALQSYQDLRVFPEIPPPAQVAASFSCIPFWSDSLMTSYATHQLSPVLLTPGWTPLAHSRFSGAPGTDVCTWGPSLPLASQCACGLVGSQCRCSPSRLDQQAPATLGNTRAPSLENRTTGPGSDPVLRK